MSKQECRELGLELKEARLELLDLKKKLILNEAILQDILYIIIDNRTGLHICEPGRIKKLKGFLKLLKINRGVK